MDTSKNTDRKMKTVKILFILPVLLKLIFLVSCAESDEKILERLNLMISRGEHQKAGIEIDSILYDLNDGLSETIRSSPLPRKFNRNRTGNVVTWLEGDTLYYFNGELESVSLDETGKEVKVSDNGKYAIVQAPLEDQCLLYPLNLETGTEYPEIILDKCEGSSAITDSGEIWYPFNGKIFKKKNPDSDEEAEEALDRKKFTEKYKKIKHDYFLFSAPGNNLLIFYGAAGYYRLYSYDINADKLIYTSDKPVKPYIFWVQKNDILFPEENETSSSNNEAYIYTGSIGKFTLTSLIINPGPKLGKSLNPPVLDNDFIPVSGNERFYFFNELSQLTVLNSKKGSSRKLPVRGNSLMIIDKGLFYNSEENHLKLRTTPFSDFEKKLLQMKQNAEEN